MKKILSTLFLPLILLSCTSLQEAGKVLRNEKIKSTDEFLVKKKEPLVLPPDFSKLPKPNEQPETAEEEVNIKSVFDGEQSGTKKDNNQNFSKSNIKKSISDKIQKQ